MSRKSIRITTFYILIITIFLYIHIHVNVEKEIEETISWLDEKIQQYQINGIIKAEYKLFFEEVKNEYYIIKQ